MNEYERFALHCIRECNAMITEYERHHKLESDHFVTLFYKSGFSSLKVAKRSFEEFIDQVRDLNAGGV